MVMTALRQKLSSREVPEAELTETEARVYELVLSGAVPVRALSQWTTQVLRAVQEAGKPVLITRHGRVVAQLSPTTTRDVLDRMEIGDGAQTERVADELALAEKETSSAHSAAALPVR